MKQEVTTKIFKDTELSYQRIYGPLQKAPTEDEWQSVKWGPPLMPERRSLLSDGDRTIIAYNTDCAASLPKKIDMIGSNLTPSPLYLRKPNWLCSRHPFLGHGPAIPQFQGLFEPLYAPGNLFTTETVGPDHYRLESNLRKEWESLENMLVRVMTQLARYIQPADNPFTLEFSYYPFPSRFGYKEAHDAGTITNKLTESRDAYIALISAIRMFVEVIRRSSRKHGYIRPGTDKDELDGWTNDFATKNNIPPSWLEDLLRSDAGDDHVKRIGAFVNLYNENSCAGLERAIKLGMPVWISWGNKGNPVWYSDLPSRQIKLWEKFHPRPVELDLWINLRASELTPITQVVEDVFEKADDFNQNNDWDDAVKARWRSNTPSTSGNKETGGSTVAKRLIFHGRR